MHPIRTAGKSFIGEQTVSKRIAVSLANKTEEGLIKIKCTGTEELPLDKIKEFQGALKKRTKAQKEKLLESLKTYGFSFPFFIWKNEGINWCLDGHGRLEVLNSLLNKDQLPTFPVVYVQAEDEAEAKKKLLQLNSQYGEIDTEGLQEFIDGIDIDMSEFEIPDINLDGLIEPKEEGAIPEVEEGEPICKLGDIWQLGNHRLMCGDSTNGERVDLLMDGRKADLGFTDPPYGMKKENEGVLNDNLNKDDLLEFNKKWIPLSLENIKENGSWYCWGMDEVLMDIYSEILKPMKRNGEITFRNLITWNKGSGQGMLSEEYRMYPIADEKCLFIMKGVQGFNNNSDNYYDGWEPIRKYLYDSRIAMGWDVPTMKGIVGHSDKSGDHWTSKSQWVLPTEKVYNKLKREAEKQRVEQGIENDAFKKEYDEIRKEFYSTRAYFDNTHEKQTNVWEFRRTTGEERKETGGHATPKPLELCGRAIKSSTREGELVLDLFGGSGSTLIACEKLKRVCYMMELDEKYCDVIIKRWENYTGEKAVKING